MSSTDGKRDDATTTGDAMPRSRTPVDPLLAPLGQDLRSPLTGVIGMAELLRSTRLDGEQLGYLDALRHSADSLLATVDALVDLWSLDGDGSTQARTVFSPAQVAREVVERLRPRAEGKGLALLLWLNALPERAVGDPPRLRQALLRLLSAAIDTAPRGEVRLELSTRPDADGGWRLFGRLDGAGDPTDDGQHGRIAANADDLALDPSLRDGRSGFAVAVCARLLERIGGRLEIDARADGSQRFRFDARFEREAPAPAPAGQPASLDALRVLVVDDDVVSRTLALAVLGRHGITARVAHDGREALVEVMSRPFDVVIMDVRMPGLDGLAATRAIRALPAGGHAPWIVAVTSELHPDDRRRCSDAGMDDFIAKPFLADTLRAALQRGLDHALRGAR
jgi:CheY-like chemotaxis protein